MVLLMGVAVIRTSFLGGDPWSSLRSDSARSESGFRNPWASSMMTIA